MNRMALETLRDRVAEALADGEWAAHLPGDYHTMLWRKRADQALAALGLDDLDYFAAVLWAYLPDELGPDSDSGPTDAVQREIVIALTEAFSCSATGEADNGD